MIAEERVRSHTDLSWRHISQPRTVDLLPPKLQMIPEALGKNTAIRRARTRARTMAVANADGAGGSSERNVKATEIQLLHG